MHRFSMMSHNHCSVFRTFAPLILACHLITLIGCNAVHRNRTWAETHPKIPRTGMISVEGGQVWYQIVGDGPGMPLLILFAHLVRERQNHRMV